MRGALKLARSLISAARDKPVRQRPGMAKSLKNGKQIAPAAAPALDLPCLRRVAHTARCLSACARTLRLSPPLRQNGLLKGHRQAAPKGQPGFF